MNDPLPINGALYQLSLTVKKSHFELIISWYHLIKLSIPKFPSICDWVHFVTFNSWLLKIGNRNRKKNPLKIDLGKTAFIISPEIPDRRQIISSGRFFAQGKIGKILEKCIQRCNDRKNWVFQIDYIHKRVAKINQFSNFWTSFGHVTSGSVKSAVLGWSTFFADDIF